MDFIFINIGIVLLALIFASYFDLRKKEIPDFITYPLIIIGFFIMLLNMAALSGTGVFQYSILIAAISFFLFGAFLNKKGWFGGGDVKLITGIILMTPIKFMSFEFYLMFFLFTCVCALTYYIISIIFSKEKFQKNAYVKFAPALLVGFIVAVIAFL